MYIMRSQSHCAKKEQVKQLTKAIHVVRMVLVLRM